MTPVQCNDFEERTIEYATQSSHSCVESRTSISFPYDDSVDPLVSIYFRSQTVETDAAISSRELTCTSLSWLR